MCTTLCDLAGVMYWGDAYSHRIETANIDGSGRKLIVTVNNARYFAFTLHAGIIYYTSWNPPYVHLLVARLTQYDSTDDDTCMFVCLSVCLSSVAHYASYVRKLPNQSTCKFRTVLGPWKTTVINFVALRHWGIEVLKWCVIILQIHRRTGYSDKISYRHTW